MLEEKILNDYKEAMKNNDALKVSTLSFLRAQFINLAIEKKKKSLDDIDCVAVIKKSVKQHQDSIEQFKQGSRQDLADKESRELEILKSYLPPELAEEEIKKIIEEVIVLIGASGIKDMGRVMKEVTAKVAGQADGKLVSGIVRERLSKPASE